MKESEKPCESLSSLESAPMWGLFGSGDQNERRGRRGEDVIGPISPPFISS
jgi:hypothetical protein